MSTPTRIALRHLLRLPARSPRPVSARLLSVSPTPHYRLESWSLELNGCERVPAYFTRPLEGAAPFPTILFSHSHGGRYHWGKKELIRGSPYMGRPPYAEALARAGFAALCVDHWCFGERATRTESSLSKEMLWRGKSMWGLMVADSLRALDWLCTRADVDARRIGAIGMSMGSTMSWYVAALDTRIAACADLCCLTDFDAIIQSKGLDEHGIYYYVPDLLNRFTTAQINALIAPRPHLGLAGLKDPLTPVDGLRRIDRELKSVYRQLGAPQNWRLRSYPGAHVETPAMRTAVMAFLKKTLGEQSLKG